MQQVVRDGAESRSLTNPRELYAPSEHPRRTRQRKGEKESVNAATLSTPAICRLRSSPGSPSCIMHMPVRCGPRWWRCSRAPALALLCSPGFARRSRRPRRPRTTQITALRLVCRLVVCYMHDRVAIPPSVLVHVRLLCRRKRRPSSNAARPWEICADRLALYILIRQMCAESPSR
jgi:hypothetical protein